MCWYWKEDQGFLSYVFSFWAEFRKIHGLLEYILRYIVAISLISFLPNYKVLPLKITFLMVCWIFKESCKKVTIKTAMMVTPEPKLPHLLFKVLQTISLKSYVCGFIVSLVLPKYIYKSLTSEVFNSHSFFMFLSCLQSLFSSSLNLGSSLLLYFCCIFGLQIQAQSLWTFTNEVKILNNKQKKALPEEYPNLLWVQELHVSRRRFWRKEYMGSMDQLPLQGS